MSEEQRKATESISTMYTMETLKSASDEIEVYGDIMEVPKEEYVEWLERKVYDSIKAEKGVNRTYRIETYTRPFKGRTELINLCDKRAKVGGFFCLKMCSCKIKVDGEYVICKKPIDKQA